MSYFCNFAQFNWYISIKTNLYKIILFVYNFFVLFLAKIKIQVIKVKIYTLKNIRIKIKKAKVIIFIIIKKLINLSSSLSLTKLCKNNFQ